MRRVTLLKGIAGVLLLALLLLLGFAARGAWLTGHDLRIDQALRPGRFPLATTVFLALTAAASEVIGLAALAIGTVALFLRRRRWDALRLVAMAGCSWVLALAVKALIHRQRPPASLWLLKPDSPASFPSGHDTTASVIVLVALMALAGTGRLRWAATALAVVFDLAVGVSRIYLGDHYPTDVLGSYLTVGAAALLVWAITDLPPIQALAARVLRQPEIATPTAGQPTKASAIPAAPSPPPATARRPARQSPENGAPGRRP